MTLWWIANGAVLHEAAEPSRGQAIFQFFGSKQSPTFLDSPHRPRKHFVGPLCHFVTLLVAADNVAPS